MFELTLATYTDWLPFEAPEQREAATNPHQPQPCPEPASGCRGPAQMHPGISQTAALCPKAWGRGSDRVEPVPAVPTAAS